MDSYDVDFGSIDRVMDEILGNGDSFQDYRDVLTEGETPLSFEKIFTVIKDVITGELGAVKELFVQMMVIVIIASIFINLSKTLKSRQVSETGFYVAYMLLFMLITVTFSKLEDIAFQSMDNLLSFMEALVPAFFITVTYVSGSSTAVIFYQTALVIISLVEVLLLKIFLPAVNIYFVFSMLNPIFGEDMFSKLIELIEKLIVWGLKMVFALVAGVTVIQGMIIPAAGNVKRTILGKALSSVPGAGNTMGQMFESVYGAANLIKNAVGTAGLIVIVTICAAPVIRLLVYSVVIQAGAAIAQPASNDKRLINCMSMASKAFRLLLSILAMTAVLFMLTIAIVIMSTNPA